MRGLIGFVLVVLFCRLNLALSAETNSRAQDLAARFRNPTSEFSAKERWWWPGADVNENELSIELAEMSRAHLGGAEISFLPPASGLDLNKFGWASDAHRRALESALREAQENKTSIDLTLGPSWPLSTPSIASLADVRAEQELVSASSEIPVGACFDGAVPSVGNDAGQLVAVTAARKLDAGKGSLRGYTSARPPQDVQAPSYLDPTSLIELDLPKEDRGLHWCPAQLGAGWIVFGFWQRPTGQKTNREVGAKSAYVIDHFSAAATAALINDWETKILNPEIRRLLRTVGSDFFGDSLELTATQLWTNHFLTKFARLRGYRLNKYLPLLHIENIHQAYAGIMGGSRSPDNAPDFEVVGVGPRVREDYYRTLNDLMESEHLKPLADWTHSLGMRLRYQPAYGTTLNLISNARYVDVPETESLHSGNQIDYHRAMASAAHVLGKQIISSECCAVMLGDYGQTIADALQQIRKNFIGGVNQIVLHGRPYKWADSSVAWPGWQPFSPSAPVDFSEAWDSRQPFWKQINDFTEYLQRTQLILRQGRARINVAVYRDSFWWPSKRWFFEETAKPLYDDSSLSEAGYSYDFLDASLVGVLASPLSSQDGTTNKNSLVGPGYRALIIDNQRALSLETVRHFSELVQNGLKLIFVGALPERVSGFDTTGQRDGELRAALEKLLRQPHVVRVALKDDVPQALKVEGVEPALRLSGLANIVTTSRETAVMRSNGSFSRARIFYIYNNGSSTSSGQVTVDSSVISDLSQGVMGAKALHAYVLDAWTGNASALKMSDRSSADHETSFDFTLPASKDLILYLSNEELSGNTKPQAPVKRGGLMRLSQWSLEVDEYDSNQRKRLSFKNFDLRSWADIPELQNVSGIGEYKTHFNAPVVGGKYQIRVGRIEGKYRLFINQKQVMLNDPFLDEFDISDLVRTGDNEIRIEVCTTLGNKLMTLWQAGWAEQIKNVYQQMGAPFPTKLPYTLQTSGLIGPVDIQY